MELILYIVFFGIYFTNNYKKYGLNGSSFLIFVYLLSASMSLILLFCYNQYDLERISIYAVLYHIFCLFLFLSTVVVFFNRYPFEKPLLTSKIGMKILLTIIIFFCGLSIAVNIPKLYTAFSNPDLRMVRIMANHGILYEETSKNIFEYLATFGHMFSFIAMFLFFNFIVHQPQKKLLIIVLGICSLADVLKGFTVMGRGGVVRFLLFALFWFFCYRHLLPKIIIKKIIRYSIIFTIPLIIIFILISTSRFSGRDESVTYYFIDYFGQAFINFSYNFDGFMDDTFGGRINFPNFFSEKEQLSNKNVNDIIVSEDYLNTFSTFVGSFYKDMGFIKTLFLALGIKLMSIYTNYVIKTIKLPNLMFNIIIMQVVLTGVFYYMYAGTMAFNSFILIILVSYFIYFFFTFNRKKVWKNKTI